MKDHPTEQSLSRMEFDSANVRLPDRSRDFTGDLILDETEVELVDLVRLLSQSADVEPSLQFRQNARRQLLQKLPARPTVAPPPLPRRPSWPQRLWGAWRHGHVAPRTAVAWLLIIIFSFVALFSTGGVLYASGQALPGETLYPLKLGLEDWQMERADNSVALANFHLAFAGRRLDEIDQLLLLEQPTAIPTAAERYIYHARQTEAILLATRVVSAADRDEFDDTLGLGSSVQESFSQNELILIHISRHSRPESWPGLNRALAATGDAREVAQTLLLNMVASDNSAIIHLRLQFADGRLAMADALADAGRSGDLSRTLTAYSEQIESASALLTDMEADEVLLTEWEATLGRQDAVLQEIAQRAPVAARAALAHARTVSQKGRRVGDDLQLETLPALDADLPGGGPPEDKPGGGPPEDKPGGGPPEDKPGGGPPEDKPGGGPPEDKPGGGPPEDKPGGGPPEDKPGGGPPEDKPGGGPPEDKPGGGPPEDKPGGGPPEDKPGGGPPEDKPGGGR